MRLLKLLTLLVLSVTFHNSYAQIKKHTIDSTFNTFKQFAPKEKIYLHTDKEHYPTGGTIWIKAYLVTATANTTYTQSRYVYVELYDHTHTLVQRIKLLKENDIFAGQIKLSKDLNSGLYYIKAYTRWMMNDDEEYMFTKTIHLFDSERDRYTASIKFDSLKNKLKSAVVLKKGQDPLKFKTVNITIAKQGQITKTLKRQTNKFGKMEFSIDADQFGADDYVELAIDNDDIDFKKRFPLPHGNTQFDLQFFAQGGHLLLNSSNIVAFKAIGTDGLSRKVNGYILNSSGDTLSLFKSVHKGMGAFNIDITSSESYTAYAWIDDNLKTTTKFTLPEVTESAVKLSVVHIGNYLKIMIKANGDQFVKPFYLVVHTGEKMLFKQLIERMDYTLSKKDLPEGIVNLLLVDGNNQPVSSRAVFNKKSSRIKFDVTSNKQSYTRRDKVELALSLNEDAPKSHLSIAVTDDQVVGYDSLKNNILSTLLLTSELKGFIESPGFYFLNNSDSIDNYLDLLMLTQGWKRFDVDQLFASGLKAPEFPVEITQSISGKYARGFKRKIQGAPMAALSLSPPSATTTVCDDQGYFNFDQMLFEDSTTFIIKSLHARRTTDNPIGTIVLNKDTFPEFTIKLPLQPEKVKQVDNDTELLSRLMAEGGNKHILLDELTVTATDKSSTEKLKYGLATVISEKEIKKKYPISITADKLVMMLPSVYIRDKKLFFAGNEEPLLLLVDDMEMELDNISDLESDDLKSIVPINDGTAAFYRPRGGAGGIIFIETKTGMNKHRDFPGIVRYQPLGYQKRAQFYVPKYEVDSIMKQKNFDMRSTIYWNPEIKPDSTGRANISFYTADPDANYTYIIEGVTQNGDILRKVGKLYRRKEEN